MLDSGRWGNRRKVSCERRQQDVQRDVAWPHKKRNLNQQGIVRRTLNLPEDWDLGSTKVPIPPESEAGDASSAKIRRLSAAENDAAQVGLATSAPVDLYVRSSLGDEGDETV